MVVQKYVTKSNPTLPEAVSVALKPDFRAGNLCMICVLSLFRGFWGAEGSNFQYFGESFLHK
jgi:hypothetical protein